MKNLVKRIHALWLAILGSSVSELEAQHAEALLELERAELCRRIAKYNRGLAGHAALCERTKRELSKLEREQADAEARLTSRLADGDRSAAGRHALRLEEIARQRAALSERLSENEATYAELVRARELAIAATRDKLDALGHGIRDMKSQAALAELTEMASGMRGSCERSGATLERLLEQIEERRSLAIGRVRVAREGSGAAQLLQLEAEREALAESALRRLTSGRSQSSTVDDTYVLPTGPHA